MNQIPSNPILKFNPNQLSDVRNSFDYGDVNKLNQAIDLFEDWIKKQNHFTVREFDREYLERYLISNKGSVERAKKHLDRLCTMRNLMPEFLRNFDMKNEFNPLFKCSYQCVLPRPTPDNYRVFVSTIHSEDHDKAELINYYRYMIVFLEYMLCHDYNAGYEVIMDCRNIILGMITKINPIVVHKALTLLVEAFGLRLKAMHLIINSKFVDTVVSIFKQGMSEKLAKRLQVHKSIESLYKFVPREILPKDFGGNEKCIKDLYEEDFKELSSEAHIARLKEMERAVTDETCRLSCKFNEEYSGMPGSFKSLCVD